jgi:hypothetical protein
MFYNLRELTMQIKKFAVIAAVASTLAFVGCAKKEEAVEAPAVEMEEAVEAVEEASVEAVEAVEEAAVEGVEAVEEAVPAAE